MTRVKGLHKASTLAFAFLLGACLVDAAPPIEPQRPATTKIFQKQLPDRALSPEKDAEFEEPDALQAKWDRKQNALNAKEIALARKQLAAVWTKSPQTKWPAARLTYEPLTDETDHPKLRKELPKWWNVRLPEPTGELAPGTYDILDWETFSTFLGHDDWLLVKATNEDGDVQPRWIVLPDTPVLNASIDFELPPLSL